MRGKRGMMSALRDEYHCMQITPKCNLAKGDGFQSW